MNKTHRHAHALWYEFVLGCRRKHGEDLTADAPSACAHHESLQESPSTVSIGVHAYKRAPREPADGGPVLHREHAKFAEHTPASSRLETPAAPSSDLIAEQQPVCTRTDVGHGKERQIDAMAAQSTMPSGEASVTGIDQRALDAREQALDAREQALGAREKALGAREKELGAREQALGAREKELDAREKALTWAVDHRENAGVYPVCSSQLSSDMVCEDIGYLFAHEALEPLQLRQIWQERQLDANAPLDKWKGEVYAWLAAYLISHPAPTGHMLGILQTPTVNNCCLLLICLHLHQGMADTSDRVETAAKLRQLLAEYLRHQRSDQDVGRGKVKLMDVSAQFVQHVACTTMRTDEVLEDICTPADHIICRTHYNDYIKRVASKQGLLELDLLEHLSKLSDFTFHVLLKWESNAQWLQWPSANPRAHVFLFYHENHCTLLPPITYLSGTEDPTSQLRWWSTGDALATISHPVWQTVWQQKLNDTTKKTNKRRRVH